MLFSYFLYQYIFSLAQGKKPSYSGGSTKTKYQNYTNQREQPRYNRKPGAIKASDVLEQRKLVFHFLKQNIWNLLILKNT